MDVGKGKFFGKLQNLSLLDLNPIFLLKGYIVYFSKFVLSKNLGYGNH